MNYKNSKLVSLFLIHRLSVFVIVLRGLKEALKKRLKAFYKRRKLTAAHIQPHTAKPRVDFLLVIDFEATCQENTTNYRHEIIEFPIVVIDTHRCQVVGDNCVCDVHVCVVHSSLITKSLSITILCNKSATDISNFHIDILFLIYVNFVF